MRIVLHGAVGGQVTGSAYLVQTDKARVMIDCGLFQGVPNADDINRAAGASSFKRLDAVLLTHAHLDHTGRLPLLVQRQYAGPIYCTRATIELMALILQDAARIQASDMERTNRRRIREGEEPAKPLYVPQDVDRVMRLVSPVSYQTAVHVAKGIYATWTEAGHMLGSASLQLTIDEKGHKKTIVFSGDLGQRSAPILRHFEPFTQADVVFLECTYGDRDHRSFNETVEEFTKIVHRAADEGGKILVPTPAIGRAQLIVALASWMFRRKKVRPFPVFLDSPMAVEATKIYAKHPELWNEEMQHYAAERRLIEDLKPSGSRVSVTADESRKLNDLPGPCMILAGAGMCNAGRILHHLRNNLWKPQTHVLFVGYQAPGTIGRSLIEGAKRVRIFGEPVAVKATIHSLGGFSAHAGQSDLLHWMKSMAGSKPRVILTHGEDAGRHEMAVQLKRQFSLKAELPEHRQAVEI